MRRNSSLLVSLKTSLYLLLLLSLPLDIQAQTTYALTNNPNTLKAALSQLEKEYGIYFSYDPSQIKGITTPELTNQPDLQSTLRLLLLNTNLTFQKIDEQFYVVKRANSKFIKLKVMDSETNEALPFATVKRKNTNLGIVTDDGGIARIVVADPEEAVLEIIYLGFETYNLHLDSLADQSDLNIVLAPEPIDLNDYELREYLNPGVAADPKANSFKILPQEMEILPGLSERDVLLSAQIISGVNSNDESASGINVRGSSRDNTLLYWNNVPIYHTAHYFGNISSFIPSSIGTLDIYKNYIPVKYGGASAGLISLESRNEIDNTINAEISVNMTHADGFLKTPLLNNRSSLMIAARRSYNDVIPTWTFNSYGRKLFNSETRDRQGLLENNEFSNDLNFSDINLQWNYEPSDRTSVKFSYIKGRSQFNYSEDDPEDRQNIRQEHSIKSSGADLSFAYRLNESSSITSSLANSNYSMSYTYNNIRNPDFESDDDAQSRSNDINNLEARVAYTKAFNTRSKLNIGYQFNYFDIENLINTENFLEEDEAEEIDSKSPVQAFFTDFNIQPTDRLELVLSGRLTHLESLEENYFSPQIKANYDLGRNLLFKSSYGIYHQYLSTIKESQITLSNAIEQHWLLADDEELVPMVINKQASVGIIYNSPDWLFDFDFYQKHINGLLARNLGFGFTREDGFNQGEENLLGIDLTIRKRWRYLKTWFSYNFQDSEVQFRNLFPNSFPSNLNIRHQFNLSTSYTKGNWEFSFGYTFKTGAPYTSVDNIRLNNRNQNPPPPPNPDDDDDDDDNRDRFQLVFSQPNSLRLPDYHRFDASIWHRFKGQHWNGEIGLSFINIFNRKNVYNIGYLVDFNREGNVAILERTKYFLEFTPNLSLRFNF